MRARPVAALALVVAACSSGCSGTGGSAGSRVGGGGGTTTTAPASPSTAPVATTGATGAGTTRPGATTTPAGPGATIGPGTTGPTGATLPGSAIAWSPGPWVAAGRLVNGIPAVFTTLLRPSTGGPPVGAARLDGSRLRFALYAGTTDPGGPWSNQGAVPSGLWPQLVATFNSGFKLNASRGGFYADGRAGVALRSGAASLVIFQDGSATVGLWGRDVQPSANVAAVRQNLELLVDGGRPAPNIATNVQPTWGFTLNNVIANWRSGVGVNAAGQVVYVGGPGVDPAGLAGALIAVGALRAMELDINPAWVSFSTYTSAGGAGGGLTGAKLLPGMNFAPNHYLSPGPRDFFAVFAR